MAAWVLVTTRPIAVSGMKEVFHHSGISLTTRMFVQWTVLKFQGRRLTFYFTGDGNFTRHHIVVYVVALLALGKDIYVLRIPEHKSHGVLV